MVIGGVLGGALGSQVGGGEGRTVATIVGTLAGASVGGAVGRSMDEQDRIKVAHTMENVRTGVASRWRNPDTGNEYAVEPTRTYESGGTPCREYTINGAIGEDGTHPWNRLPSGRRQLAGCTLIRAAPFGEHHVPCDFY
jgi:surface antigen